MSPPMMPRLNTSLLRTAVLGAFASVLTVAALPAQQMVTETRDPKQKQDAEFAKLVHRVDAIAGVRQSARRSPSARVGHSDAEGRARLLHRRAGEAHLLRRHPEVLPRAREGVEAREDRDDRQVGRRTRARHRLRLVGRQHQESRGEQGQAREDRRPARADRRAGQGAHPDDEAALSPDGRTAQRRDGSVGNVDGARVSPRDRDVAADQLRFATTSSSRSRRPPSRTVAIATSTGSIAASISRPTRRRAAVAAAARADSSRTGASTSSTTTIATSTSRSCRCARSPIGTSRRIRRSFTICTKRSR